MGADDAESIEEKMDNQHRLITGYRELNESEIGLMNQIKKMANDMGLFMDSLNANENIDKRWLVIAKTDLQKGFMCLIRSIARPDSF